MSEFKKGGKKKDNVISPDAKTLTPTQTNTGKAAVYTVKPVLSGH